VFQAYAVLKDAAEIGACNMSRQAQARNQGGKCPRKIQNMALQF